MRVLVIEAELQLARHVTRALLRTGHEASAAHNGAEGLRVSPAQGPDLMAAS